MSLVLDTRASHYDHQGDGHGGHKGRFKSEADALREALPFRAWCEFGRGKATQWRVKTPAERVALVNGWLQDDETASSSPSTVGQQQSSEITPDQPESAFQMRLAQRNAFKAAKQLLRDDDDVAGEHILNAEYYERQVEDLAQGRADIEVVCADPDGASVRQAKKIVMQTLAVSSYCSELGRRERVLANGGTLEPSLKTTHSLADRVARGFNISGRTLRDWFALWINNDCFALDRRGKSSAASLIHEEDVSSELTTFMLSRLKSKGSDAISVANVLKWLNETYLPGLDQSLLDDYGIVVPIVYSTAYEWMKKSGGVALKRRHL
eukprot:gene28673-23226_t